MLATPVNIKRQKKNTDEKFSLWSQGMWYKKRKGKMFSSLQESQQDKNFFRHLHTQKNRILLSTNFIFFISLSKIWQKAHSQSVKNTGLFWFLSGKNSFGDKRFSLMCKWLTEVKRLDCIFLVLIMEKQALVAQLTCDYGEGGFQVSDMLSFFWFLYPLVGAFLFFIKR